MKTGKNLIVLFAVLFISFLSLIQEAEADCPDGWSADTVSNTYNGCDYIIYYCYMTDPNGVVYTRIDWIAYDNDCIEMIGTSAFWDNLNEAIINKLMMDNSFPPCPAMTYNVIYSRAKCWKVINDHVNEICNIINCGYEGECKLMYKICTDYTAIPPQVIKELVGTQSVDNETCSAEMPDFSDEEEFDPDEDWMTECFVVDCDLD